MKHPYLLLFCPIIVALPHVNPAFAQAPVPQPLTAKMIVDEAVQEVRKHRRTYDAAVDLVLKAAKNELNAEINRLMLGGQQNLSQVLAIRKLIGNLESEVTKRADAPMPAIQENPPPMEMWVLGKWTGVNTPQIYEFKKGGGLEGLGKTAEAKNWTGLWKSERHGYIDTDIKNGGRWEIRRCGPNAMAVISFAADKQIGDGFVLLRILDPIVGQWKWFNEGVHELCGDGQITGFPGASWSVTDPEKREYILRWENGKHVDTVVLSPDGMILQGKNDKGVEVRAERIQ